ncbi:hypothetical protein niasHS_007269 [Heterodera schachtii]|uniref:Iron-binding zinc finger CDGSH type domain-containing protein n=1 Tax=Heterodera schachtii TaxID=97005 RepID=A0ABD2JK59_HETSC
MSSSAMGTQPALFDRSNIAFAMSFLAGGLAIGYLLGWRTAASKLARCNTRVQLSKDKVVDTVELEDIGEKKAYCRCWQSKKFPLCDGSHNEHNKKTGDNVGPLIVQKAKSAS